MGCFQVLYTFPHLLVLGKQCTVKNCLKQSNILAVLCALLNVYLNNQCFSVNVGRGITVQNLLSDHKIDRNRSLDYLYMQDHKRAPTTFQWVKMVEKGLYLKVK